MSYKMKSATSKALGISTKILESFRMYQPSTAPRTYKIQSYLVYIFLVLPLPYLGILNLIMKDEIDMDRLNYDAPCLAQCVSFSIKYIAIIRNGKQIKYCIDYFESDFFSAKLRFNHKEIIQECVKVCRRNTIIYVSIMAGAVVVFGIRPFLWKNIELPCEIWLPSGMTSNTFFFYSVYLYLALDIGYVAIASSGIDPLIAGLASFAVSHFKILQDNLQHLGEYGDEEISETNLDKFKLIYDKIGFCVDYHNAILIFVKKFEKSLSLPIFCQIMGSLLVVCFSCLQITKLETFDLASVLQMGTYAIAVAMQIYLYCHYGTALYEESNNLTKAIYMSEWYKFDLKSQRALSILLERTQKPVIVTSAKVMELSLATFAAILRGSYSLLAVLKKF